MRNNDLAMSLGGLAAIIVDYVVVASIVGLMLLTRWLGIGWTLDCLTVLLVSYGIIVWFYAKRFSQFLNRREAGSQGSVMGRNFGSPLPVKSTVPLPGSRLNHLR